MAVTEGSTPEEVRRRIQVEREQLAAAVESLRTDLGKATDVGAKLRPKLPLLAGGALGTGFLLAGGIGATARLIFRRGREHDEDEKVRVGRFSLRG